MDPKIPLVLYDGYSPTADPVTLTWAELLEALSTKPDAACAPKGTKSTLPVCVGRKCPAKVVGGWSPVELSVLHRKNENVRAVTAVVIDIDHINAEALERVRASVADFRHIIHSTHSHNPPDDGCYRLVMPLSRPALPSEWPTLWRSIVEVFELPADPVAKDISRFYFLPTVREGVPFHFESRAGAEINVDGALETCPAADSSATTNAVAAATPAPIASDAPVDLGALRDRIAQVRISKSHGNERAKEQAEILGLALDGKPLGTIGQLHGRRVCLAGMLGYQLPSGTPWESVLEILRPMFVASPLAPGDTIEGAIEKTRKLYEGTMAWRADQDAKVEAARAATQALRERVKGSASPSGALGNDEDPEAWKKLLLLTNGGNVRGCEHNAELLLACAPELRSTIRWNDVKKRIEIFGGPLAGADRGERLDRRAAGHIQLQYSFMGGVKLVHGALRDVAMANAYDPIKEYLSELAWDQQPRIDEFLEKYCGADVSEPDRAKYVRAVSRRFLISLVARAYEPGCKVDTMLILEGDQGIGKSTALNTLVGREYFLDSKLDIGSKDALMLTGKAWLCEMAELASMRRVDTETIKQFLSNAIDEYRPPYGTDTVETPRRCCFAATVNPDGDNPYLRDPTGNRRFWCVRCDGEIDLEGITRDRDQLFAEAVVAHRSGARWWLDKEQDADIIRLARAEAADREEMSTEEEAIDSWWHGMKPSRRPKRVTMSEVAKTVLDVDAKDVDLSRRTRIGRALSRMGFGRHGGGRRRYYEASEALLAAPERTDTMRAAGIELLRGAVDTRST